MRDQLDAAGIRVHLDDRKEKVNLKIREAQLQKIPYMLVVGDREAEAGTVSVRNRKHGDQGVKPLAEFVNQIQQLISDKTAIGVSRVVCRFFFQSYWRVSWPGRWSIVF